MATTFTDVVRELVADIENTDYKISVSLVNSFVTTGYPQMGADDEFLTLRTERTDSPRFVNLANVISVGWDDK